MAVMVCKEKMSQEGEKGCGGFAQDVCRRISGHRQGCRHRTRSLHTSKQRRRKLSESRDSWLLHWQPPLSSSLIHSYLCLPCPTSAMLRPGLSLFAGQELNLSSVSRMSRALPRSAHTQLSSAQPDLTSLSLPSQAARWPSQVGARVHRAAPHIPSLRVCAHLR